MRGSESTGEPRPNLIKLALVLAAAVLLGWLVIRSASVNALMKDDAGAASAVLSAGDPRVVLAKADADLRQERGAVEEQALNESIAASKRAPLDETPFLLAGATALRGGNGDRAELLLTEARERNPRSRTARFLLLEHYVKSGRASEAAREMAVLTRLMPDARPVLIAGLARFAQSLPDSPAVAHVLKADPAVQSGVLEHLAATGGSPKLILGLSQGLQPSAGANWPQAVIAALVDQGKVEQAYAQWRRFAGFPRGTAPAGIFNPNFEDLPALPPFDWRLAEGENTLTQSGRGLSVQYAGDRQSGFAEQLLLLPPGNYSVSFKAEGEDADRGPRLIWSLSCHGNGARLVSVPIDASPVIAHFNEAEFTVPERCPAQWIRLIGLPGRQEGTLAISISDLDISPQDIQ